VNILSPTPDFGRHRVALIDCSDRNLASLEKSLQRLGVQWLTVHEDGPPVPGDCLAAIVELDSFKSPQTLAQVRARNVPITVLTQLETLSQIQRGVALGATAILNRPITQSSVYTTLMMALALHERLGELQTQNATLREKLASRPIVAQAIARLIVDLGLGEAEAFERIRTRSMTTHRSVEAICVEILNHAAASRCSSS
jgi:AmiR/NasT family two-component response regulator